MPGLNEPAVPVSAVKLKITSVFVVAVFSAWVCAAQPYFVSPVGLIAATSMNLKRRRGSVFNRRLRTVKST